MTIYVFGNNDLPEDSLKIKYLKPNEDAVFDSRHPVILDTVEGIKEITVFKDLEKIIPPQTVTAHDFDLGLQLKYLKKLGKIDGATIIGVPKKAAKS
jgi:hypothetical protein